MTWTDPACHDLDARCAADPGYKRLAGYRELKRERMERTAAAMRAGNERKRQAAQAAIARKRREA